MHALRHFFWIFLLGLSLPAWAQHEDHEDHTGPDHTPKEVQKIHNIREFFQKGSVHGYLRNYFMATENHGNLKSYYANATGGAIHYHSPIYKGFQVGLAGIFVFNTFSNDLGYVDSEGGSQSRYERQLFDLLDDDNRTDLDRMEELYLAYHFSGSQVKVGKMDIYSPLINRQDTRMKSYVIRGIWGEIREFEKLDIDFGAFDKASARSTTHWATMAHTIGLYNPGYTKDGHEAHFHDHINTRGVGMLGITYRFHEHGSFQVWNYHFDNLLNTTFTQLDFKPELSEKQHLVFGAQVQRQFGVGNGGSEDPQFRYYGQDEASLLLGTRVGFESEKFVVNANYTHITDEGRFVFPQELGREQLYTTIARSRLEGLGGAHSVAANIEFKDVIFKNFKVHLSAAQVHSPGGGNYVLNKYGTVSYNQFNVDLRYRVHMGNFLDGLRFRFLYVVRDNIEDRYDERPDILFNSYKMHHFNFIANIEF